MPGSILAPAVTDWRGSRPSGRSCGAKASSVARREAAKGEGCCNIDHAGLAGLDGLGAGKDAGEVAIGKGDEGTSRCGCDGRSGRRADHVLDGPDAGDGVLGEGEGHGDGAGEFSIDIDGAAAHPLHDAGVLERAAGEPGEDEGFLGPEVLEDAEDFDLEFFDAVAR